MRCAVADGADVADANAADAATAVVGVAVIVVLMYFVLSVCVCHPCLYHSKNVVPWAYVWLSKNKWLSCTEIMSGICNEPSR